MLLHEAAEQADRVMRDAETALRRAQSEANLAAAVAKEAGDDLATRIWQEREYLFKTLANQIHYEYLRYR